MQIVIFSLFFPVIALLLWKSYNRERHISSGELLIRYAVYTLLTNLLVSFVMFFLCKEGSSFWSKVDASPEFVLKYAAIEAAAVLFVADVEWIYVEKRLSFQVQWQEYRHFGPVIFMRKVIFPAAVYLMAAAVVILNLVLMHDNVLWGDECFSANTADKSFAGILQVMYFWDNHPPLYYFWLKIFGDIFGHTGPMYHLASLVPFFGGVLLAVTFLRKHFGNIPAAFFIIVTGLSPFCLQYNLEIRMYSLAFLGVACCYYCAYRILCGGKAAWPGMVFWALFGAYSHYYALVVVGIMMFITFVAAGIRYKGRTWLKGLISMAAFLGGYAPWMGYLFHATDSVSNNWWMTDILSLGDSLQVIFCGAQMQGITAFLLAVSLAVIFLKESSFFRIDRKAEKTVIQVHTPSLTQWSDDAYGAAVGVLTIVGTLLIAYTLCLIIGPVLGQRYLYPLSAVTVLLLVICSSHDLELLQELGGRLQKKWVCGAGKGLFIAVLAVMLYIGIGNYRVYSAQAKAEKEATEEVLSLIGEIPADTKLVSYGVSHLGWTVLAYYFPENENIGGPLENLSSEDIGDGSFWYFSSEFLTQKQLDTMWGKGYNIAAYGEKQIAVYPFKLYYFESPTARP